MTNKIYKMQFCCYQCQEKNEKRLPKIKKTCFKIILSWLHQNNNNIITILKKWIQTIIIWGISLNKKQTSKTA